MATARLTESTKQIKTILNKNYGPVDKAQPAGPRRPVTGVRNLNTNDIEGAQVTKQKKPLLNLAQSQKCFSSGLSFKEKVNVRYAGKKTGTKNTLVITGQPTNSSTGQSMLKRAVSSPTNA